MVQAPCSSRWPPELVNWEGRVAGNTSWPQKMTEGKYRLILARAVGAVPQLQIPIEHSWRTNKQGLLGEVLPGRRNIILTLILSLHHPLIVTGLRGMPCHPNQTPVARECSIASRFSGTTSRTQRKAMKLDIM